MLLKYRNLEGLFAAVDEIPKGKKRDNLVAGKEQAFLSRKLAELKRDVPIVFDWNDGRVGGIDGDAVAALSREFGFRQLAERLSTLSVLSAPATWNARYEAVATVEALDALVEKLSQQKRIVIDTETTSIYPRWADIVGYAISYQEGEGFYIPVRAPVGEPQLPPDLVRDKLRGVLEDPKIGKVGQNLKYDMIVLRSAGILLQGAEFDTMVADYLVEPGERNHNLDDLAKRYLNHENITIGTLIGTGKNQKRMDEVPVELITQYAAEDADVPMRLAPILERRLREDDVETLFRDLEMPLVDVLVELEFNGIRIDIDLLKRLSEKFAAKMAEVEREIYDIAEGPFNINSPKQLGALLFEKLKLPVIKRTQTGASTDAEVLEELARQHPLPAKIVAFRQYSKLKSTYVDALPTMVCPKTNRVHSSFNQDVAATGRLSSQDPNLQNIPVRTEEGRQIREAFLPGYPGWKLLCADYSQIELRVLAHFSKDETLQEAFASDRDIHTLVASQVYRVPLEEVNRDQRRSAKAINFGIIYGQSAFGLANSLDIPKADAQAFIDAYFERYPGVDQFMEETLDECRRLGYVKTIAGRRRPVEGVRDRSVRGNKRQRILPERIAVNSVIQGSAADLIKMAMIRLHHKLREEKPSGGPWQAKMLLQIHDELVFEAPPDELAMLGELVRQEMENVMTLGVRLKVDLKAGDNWAECEEM
jgi:DNA polymerase-1